MPRILIVEDDQKMRKNLCILLENEGYEYECAENGKIGLEKALTNLPDLIISDIMMPEFDGYELLEELQKYPETESIPFIFLTALTGTDKLREGMRSGADDYLYKPFQIEDLISAIKTRLEKKNRTEKKMSEIQKEIAGKISHELRTPLVAIIGYPELIEDEDDINKIKEMTRVIKSSSQILHRRIEKYLLYKDLIALYTKFNTGSNNKNYTTIEQNIIKYYLTTLPEELNASERVNIIVEECTVPMREEFLEVVIKEITENGLRYSENDKKVLLQGFRENGNYKILVIDNGCGIKKKEIDTINVFRKFGENRLSEEGSGLGLAIAKKILDYNNCILNIDSQEKKYTKAEITIPLNNEYKYGKN